MIFKPNNKNNPIALVTLQTGNKYKSKGLY
jgi:hypothetical protein